MAAPRIDAKRAFNPFPAALLPESGDLLRESPRGAVGV